MTLILTALTPSHVIQVSDRRVVWLEQNTVTRKQDGYIKAVITPRFACSYTGIADLGGDTAHWLAIALSDHVADPDGGVRALTTMAQQAVDTPRFRDRDLAIVCAGWVQRGAAYAAKLTLLNKTPQRPTFEITSIDITSGRQSCVFPIGQPLYADELASVSRQTEQLCKSGRDTARAIAQVLTETIRHVARSADRRELVSEEVLITSLPRIDRTRGRLVVGELVEDFWSVTCIPAGESRREQHGGPIIVGDKAAIQALPPEDAPPGDGVFVGGKIIRKPQDRRSLVVCILTNPLRQAWGWPGETDTR